MHTPKSSIETINDEMSTWTFEDAIAFVSQDEAVTA